MSLDDEYDYESEQLFNNVATIDMKRKKKITIKLVDEAGDEVDLHETISSINKYITDQLLLEEANKLRDEVYPLLTQAAMSGISYAMGNAAAAFVASQEILRGGMGQLNLMSFYLLKFLQKNNIKVVKEEEDITQDEIDRMIRISKAASTATLASMMGLAPKEIIRELMASGQITKEDLGSFNFGEDSNVSVSGEVSKEEDSDTDQSKKGSKSDPNVN